MKIAIIFLALAFVACSKGSDESIEKVVSLNHNVTENVFATEPSVYSTFFFVRNPLVGYTSLKENPLADEQLDAVTPQHLLTSKDGGEGFALSVNGINFSDISSNSKVVKASLYKSLYGQNVTFTFGNYSKGDTNTVNMYIPDLVEITSPKIEKEQELFPFCYYENFILGWNADPNNANGLVVIVEWNGTLLSGEEDRSEYVRNVDVITTDNGKASLDSRLFDSIPDRALVYITLLRGNIVLADLEGLTYRLFGESHAILPIVLIRNLN